MNDPKTMYTLRWQDYGVPIAAGTTEVVADDDVDATTGYAGATETDNSIAAIQVIAARMESPRNLIVTWTAGGGMTGGKCAAYGIGVTGRPIREEFVNTSGTQTCTGSKAFVTVDRVSIWGVTGTITGDDLIKIGVGTKVGLVMGDDEELVDIVKERSNFVDLLVVTTAARINRANRTFIPTTLGADLEIWYTTKKTLTW
jgi:hypothetical protein